jgi:hypothetical protein
MTRSLEELLSPSASRALVLGGGGPVGRAWQTGLAAGFRDLGVDFSRVVCLTRRPSNG